MGDSAKSDKISKPVKFWNGVKAEFRKITWPDKDSLLKQSIAVVVISVVVASSLPYWILRFSMALIS